MNQRAFVRVPASSGNLGPGFDVLGCALSLYNDLTIRVLNSKPGKPVIVVHGEGQGTVPTDLRNVIYKAMQFVFRKAHRSFPRIELTCVNRIPLARGLGSSSAAYLSGLLAANRLLKNPFANERILTWASELEGHPDNVAPALLGGVRASGFFNGRVVSTAWPVPDTGVVVAVPRFELSTKKARRVLPGKVPMADAVSNLSAVALMGQAFAKEPAWLRFLLNDRLHEPYRAKLIPGFYAVKEAALRAGAYGTILSGAGPTMLSFVVKKKRSQVGEAMKKAFNRAGVKCSILELGIDKKGAVVK